MTLPPIKKTITLYKFASILRLTFCPANIYAETKIVPNKDNPSPINASRETPMSPQAIMVEPIRAAIKQRMVNIFARSLNIKYEPIITNKGCNDKMTMELATEVYTKDSIQNKKCNPRNRPAKRTVLQSFLFISEDRRVFQGTKGSIMITDIYNLYIPATAVGVSEDFIMMDEIETDSMLMKSKIYG
ncbi:hypothetical protein HPL003_12765 [Paenibacillus terrae HPL-003]|uniref:Uncharacterized protein n=1 Tax=Paenibacillus terrae (strain HPL-003) TaxID=985665 RepID=G7W468_PAETH|nr:hypothetical protein HPL003_12765 [Paenibacillus terrae HPL-003]